MQRIEKLKLVFNVAGQHGLLINWKKCSFLQTRVEYSGYIAENGNVQPSEYKTKAIINFPRPKCAKDVQSFLGLTEYFRKFASLLNYRETSVNLLRKNIEFKFESQEREAFERLKIIV